MGTCGNSRKVCSPFTPDKWLQPGLSGLLPENGGVEGVGEHGKKTRGDQGGEAMAHHVRVEQRPVMALSAI